MFKKTSNSTNTTGKTEQNPVRTTRMATKTGNDIMSSGICNIWRVYAMKSYFTKS